MKSEKNSKSSKRSGDNSKMEKSSHGTKSNKNEPNSNNDPNLSKPSNQNDQAQVNKSSHSKHSNQNEQDQVNKSHHSRKKSVSDKKESNQNNESVHTKNTNKNEQVVNNESVHSKNNASNQNANPNVSSSNKINSNVNMNVNNKENKDTVTINVNNDKISSIKDNNSNLNNIFSNLNNNTIENTSNINNILNNLNDNADLDNNVEVNLNNISKNQHSRKEQTIEQNELESKSNLVSSESITNNQERINKSNTQKEKQASVNKSKSRILAPELLIEQSEEQNDKISENSKTSGHSRESNHSNEYLDNQENKEPSIHSKNQIQPAKQPSVYSKSSNHPSVHSKPLNQTSQMNQSYKSKDSKITNQLSQKEMNEYVTAYNKRLQESRPNPKVCVYCKKVYRYKELQIDSKSLIKLQQDLQSTSYDNLIPQNKEQSNDMENANMSNNMVNQDEINSSEVLITNVKKVFNQKSINPTLFPAYYNFQNCDHIICINCIGRLLFTTYLNIFPVNNEVTFKCPNDSNSTFLINLDQIKTISYLINLPNKEEMCSKHEMPYYKYCLDCKIKLCKKCEESHSDLFTNHHLVNEEPPNNDTCPYHPNCFLDMMCKDCNCQICHLCTLEGNKHFCHNAINYDNLKENIISNANGLKYDNYEDFDKYFTECNEKYDLVYNIEIEKFNNQVSDLIKKIQEYQNEFNLNMKSKQLEKNIIINTIKNLYLFFYKEYDNLEKSFDYNILSMYQTLSTELLNFSLVTPNAKNSYLSSLFNEIENIDISPYYKTKYQFSLQGYKDKKILKQHTNIINSLCVLNGCLVSASEDKTVVIWENNLSRPKITLKDFNNAVKVVKVLHDNNLICGTFQEIKIFNSNNFKCISTLRGISNIVCDVLQLDDGRVISGSYREMRIFSITWNNNFSKDSKSIKNHSSWVKALINLKDKMFASAGDDKNIFIYDYMVKCVKNVKVDFEINVLCNFLYSFDEDKNSFFVGMGNGKIYLYNFKKNYFEVWADNDQHKGGINCIIPLLGSNYASCSTDGLVVLRDNKFKAVQKISGEKKNVIAMAQMPNGKIAFGGDDYIITIYE